MDNFIKDSFIFEKTRLNRSKYFTYSLLVQLLTLIVLIIVGLLFYKSYFPGPIIIEDVNKNILTMLEGEKVNYIQYTIMILTAYPSIILGGKRLQDLNKEWWYIFISFIPLVGFIFGLYLLFAKGTTGENKFGPDPLQNT